MDKPYEKKVYFGMAVDPIHVGTGGYTLGRVDNPTLRDFDRVPKIPGTSIEGTARAYAALYFKQPQCADKEKHSKKLQDGGCKYKNYRCKICVTFGYTNSEGAKEDKKPESLQGMALFSDAKILFFPVASLIGPIWVTCPNRLKEINVDQTAWQNFDDEKSCVISEHLRSKLSNVGYLNFGWLLLQLKKKNNVIVTHNITPKTTFEVDEHKLRFEDRNLNMSGIFDRLVIVSDSVFSQIVNSNLEVRTSVSINPITGAAEEGALFTYESIPRTTIFYFDVVYQKPEHFGLNLELNEVISTVETGFGLFEFLGVGGMGTRGFGKLRVFGLDKGYDRVKLGEIQAQNLLNEIKELKGKLENFANECENSLRKVLGILSTEGIFASIIWVESKEDEESYRAIKYQMSKFLHHIFKSDGRFSGKPENLREEILRVCDNIPQMFFVKQILEKMLIYALYRARSLG
ncbi:MAG: type III-B CRISPR module RAMP protein Cmr4, partial [Candidatus Baldrarchaeia archaeon]